jgi:hypothetical protein
LQLPTLTVSWHCVCLPACLPANTDKSSGNVSECCPACRQLIWASIKELEASIPLDSKVRRVMVTDEEDAPCDGMEPEETATRTRGHYILKREFSEGAVTLHTVILPIDLLDQVACPG